MHHAIAHNCSVVFNKENWRVHVAVKCHRQALENRDKNVRYWCFQKQAHLINFRKYNLFLDNLTKQKTGLRDNK